MEGDWAVVLQSSNLQKAELAKSLLRDEGIEAIVLNQQDRSYPLIGDIKVLVKGENVILAKKIISEALG